MLVMKNTSYSCIVTFVASSFFTNSHKNTGCTHDVENNCSSSTRRRTSRCRWMHGKNIDPHLLSQLKCCYPSSHPVYTPTVSSLCIAAFISFSGVCQWKTRWQANWSIGQMQWTSSTATTAFKMASACYSGEREGNEAQRRYRVNTVAREWFLFWVLHTHHHDEPWETIETAYRLESRLRRERAHAITGTQWAPLCLQRIRANPVTRCSSDQFTERCGQLIEKLTIGTIGE